MEQKSLLDRLISEKVFYKSVIALIIAMPVVELLTEVMFRLGLDTIPSSMEPYVLLLFGLFGTMLTLVYYVTAVSQKKKFRTADLFYFTLIFFMVISTIFSQSPGVFSGGDSNRFEHPMHFLAYYWLFFAGSVIDNLKYRKNILITFLSVSLLEGIFAYLQTFNIEIAFCYLYRADRSAYGLTQNSNYYGGLCVIFVAAIAGMFIFSDSLFKSKISKFVLAASAAFVFYTMLGSRARLAWVGFSALVVFYVISFIVMYKKSDDKASLKPALKRSLIIGGVFLAVFAVTFFFTDYIREVTVRSYWEIANGDTEKVGSQRIYLWKMGLESVPRFWLTGVGLDNFGYIFGVSPNFHEGMYYKDKAHNEYLQILVTQGIPALINYLSLLIFTCVGAVKNVIHESSREKRAITWILLGAFVGYAAQAFFNNSITYVVMHFWLIIGLLIPRTPFALLKANKK